MTKIKPHKLKKLCLEAEAYWNPDYNNGMLFENVMCSKSDTFTFVCPKNAKHIFERRVDKLYNRQGMFAGCKFCGKHPKEAMSGENDFFSVCPEARQMWDFERNADIDPTRLLGGSQKVCWFKCTQNHAFSKKVINFVKNPVCEECENIEKSLAGTYPEILKLWNYKLNTVDPYNVRSFHRETIHLKCPKCRYEWKLTPGTYLKHNFCSACGYDGTEKGEEKNKEYVSASRITTFRKANPLAAAMWDYDNNPVDKNPDSLTVFSNYLGHFICEHGHTFTRCLADFNRRTNHNIICPECKKNTFISSKKDFFQSCPIAKEEWDYDKNVGINPEDLSSNSYLYAYFKCKNGHSSYRTIKAYANLPECKDCKRSVAGHEELYKFWDKTKNEYNPWMIYTTNNSDIVHWKCNDCGFSWEQTVANRMLAKGKCANCGVKKRSLNTDKSKLPFSEYNPVAASLWINDFGKGILPNSVTGTSQEFVEMSCINNPHHTYKIQICKIPTKPPYGCPYCNKYELFPGEDLFSICPEAGQMWDYDKNTQYKDVNMIKPWSHEKAFFKCKNNHSFEREIYRFCINPICSKCRVENKRANYAVTKYPKLLNQWDFEANDKDPSTIYAQSDEMANWKCKKCGYKWSARISTRYLSSGECPCCETRIVIVEGINDLFSVVPELKQYYDFEKNKGIEIGTLSVTSLTQVWWKCPVCSREWKAGVSSRVSGDHIKGYEMKPCPRCAGTERNIDFSKQFPHLIEMYDKSNPIPLSVVNGGLIHSQYKWKCKACGNSFEKSFAAMLSSAYKNTSYKGCPYCAGKRVNREYSFAALHPEIMIEYDPDNNIDPFNVTENSNLSVKWICSNNSEHKWNATFNSRAIGVGSCPICKDYNRGRRIIEVYPELERYYVKEENERPFHVLGPNSRCEATWKCENGHIFKLNIVNFSKSGRFYCPICENYQLQTGENDLSTVDPELAEEFDVEKNGLSPEEIIFHSSNENIWWKCKDRGHSFQRSIYYRRNHNRECPVCTGSIIVPGINTLLAMRPEVASEWSNSNNRSPDEIFYNVSILAKWICPTCKGEYTFPIKDRYIGDESCPYCNKDRLLPGYNSLDVTDPDLASEWSPTNERSASLFKKSSYEYVKWICPTCRGEYSAYIKDRFIGDDACPYCRNIRPLKGFNSFADKRPDLMEEWDYANNYLICSPYNILETSFLSVWWKCKTCGRKYEMSPRQKVLFDKRHMKSCVFCKGNRRKLKRFF